MLRALLLAAPLLVSCASVPRIVEGVPSGEPWTALPLRRWLAEDRIAPEAITGCWSPDCPQRLVVGVFFARGAEAAALERVLDEPERLAQALRSSPPPQARPAKGIKPKPPVRLAMQASLLREGPARGFLLTLGRLDGERAPVYGAALGLQGRDGLGVVIVVGGNEEAVADTARQVARGHLADR